MRWTETSMFTPSAFSFSLTAAMPCSYSSGRLPGCTIRMGWISPSSPPVEASELSGASSELSPLAVELSGVELPELPLSLPQAANRDSTRAIASNRAAIFFRFFISFVSFI